MSTRPHSVRRALTWLNATLAAAAAGLAVHYLFHIRPAVAAVSPRGHVPADATRAASPAWRPAMPVSRTALDGIFFRPEYGNRHSPHWPFSGPMMRPEAPVAPEERPHTAGGLDELGHVGLVVGDVVSFAFRSGGTLPFRVGEIVRASFDEPARFRLVDIVRAGNGRYRIVYDVLGAPARRGELLFDAEAEVPGGGGLQPVEPDSPDEEGRAPPVPRPVTTPPAGAPDWRGLHVRVRRAADGDRHVSFDRPAWKTLRRHGRRALAESVKTTPVSDPVTGARIGLRLAFEKPELAAAFEVKRGDVLVSVNGRPVRSRADLLAIADALSEHELVTVVIDRHGRRITYRVDPRDPRVLRDARPLLPNLGPK